MMGAASGSGAAAPAAANASQLNPGADAATMIHAINCMSSEIAVLKAEIELMKSGKSHYMAKDEEPKKDKILKDLKSFSNVTMWDGQVQNFGD